MPNRMEEEKTLVLNVIAPWPMKRIWPIGFTILSYSSLQFDISRLEIKIQALVAHTKYRRLRIYKYIRRYNNIIDLRFKMTMAIGGCGQLEISGKELKRQLYHTIASQAVKFNGKSMYCMKTIWSDSTKYGCEFGLIMSQSTSFYMEGFVIFNSSPK